jgi:alanyl-tRNA synthetase
MSEISAEVARVQSPTATTSGAEAANQRDQLLSDIRTLTTRLEESETRLQESQQRIERMGGERSGLSTQLEQVRTAMAAFEETVARQRTTIAALETQVADLQERNVVLAAEKAALEDTVVTMVTERATAYYVVGTKDDLIAQGLVTEEGGSRVLFVFGKRGKTLVPARGLDPAAFTAIDLRDMREIYLPDPEAAYRIVTNQDLTALETAPDEDGKLYGSIRIADPDRFWAGSPYLIVVLAD